jgi:hypothetical protein
MAYNRGEADVYIDGAFVERWNQDTPGSIVTWQVARTYCRPNGSHTIQIAVVGNGFVDLDAFAVDAQGSWANHDNMPPTVSYSGGGWTHQCCPWPSAYNGSVSWSKTSGNYAEKAGLNGHLIRYRFTKASNRGIANVSIDNVSRGQVDLYSSGTQWQQTITFYASTATHTFRTTVSGQKNGSANDYFVDVDSIDFCSTRAC